jgi:hypothetical protein
MEPIQVTAVGHAQPDHNPVLVAHRHRLSRLTRQPIADFGQKRE